MTFTVTQDAVHLPDQGLIVMNTMLTLRDARMHKPPASQGVWLVLETPEGGLCWELGEYRDSQMFEAGYYLMGEEQPLAESDYAVRYWCHEPPMPHADGLIRPRLSA